MPQFIFSYRSAKDYDAAAPQPGSQKGFPVMPGAATVHRRRAGRGGRPR